MGGGQFSFVFVYQSANQAQALKHPNMGEGKAVRYSFRPHPKFLRAMYDFHENSFHETVLKEYKNVLKSHRTVEKYELEYRYLINANRIYVSIYVEEGHFGFGAQMNVNKGALDQDEAEGIDLLSITSKELFTGLKARYHDQQFREENVGVFSVNSNYEDMILPHDIDEEVQPPFEAFVKDLETMLNRVVGFSKRKIPQYGYPIFLCEATDKEIVVKKQKHKFAFSYDHDLKLLIPNEEYDVKKTQGKKVELSDGEKEEAKSRGVEILDDQLETIEDMMDELNSVLGSEGKSVTQIKDKVVKNKSDEIKKELSKGLIREWDDVIGCYEAKLNLQTYAEYLKDPLSFYLSAVQIPTGVILHGPAGCGKTSLGKVLALQSDAVFVYLKGSDIRDMWYGQSEKQFEKWMKQSQAYGKAVLCMDEFDEIAVRSSDTRGGGSRADNAVISSLKRFLDGIDHREGLFFLGMTNHVNEIDETIRSRLQCIEVKLPGEKERSYILKEEMKRSILFREMKLEALMESGWDPSSTKHPDIYDRLKEGNLPEIYGKIDYDRFSRETAGMSGRDIKHINESAKRKLHKIREENPEKEISITTDMLLEEIIKFKPTEKVVGFGK